VIMLKAPAARTRSASAAGNAAVLAYHMITCGSRPTSVAVNVKLSGSPGNLWDTSPGKIPRARGRASAGTIASLELSEPGASVAGPSTAPSPVAPPPSLPVGDAWQLGAVP